jgi:hypothetical protein
VRPVRASKGPGRALVSGAMTWLWTALIVVGVVMIAVALWPNIKGRGKGPDRPDDQ